MQMKPSPSQSELQRMFTYDAASGSLKWNHRSEMDRRWNNRHPGNEAGYATDKHGRRKVEINKDAFFVHRLIWKLVHNEEPAEVDHKDRDPSNNRLNNLRAATGAENRQNRRSPQSRLPKGVSPNHTGFQAQIAVDKRKIYLGTYRTVAEAQAAYAAAALKYHGEFACLENRS